MSKKSPSLQQFEQNGYLRQFLSPHFSPKEFLRENLRNYSQANYNQPLDEIKKGLKILDDKVKVEIEEHHEPMIQNMLHTLQVTKEVNNVSGEVNRLARSGGQVREAFKDKYDRMNQRCRQFRNICSTSEILRTLDRYLRLYRNIHAQSHLDLPVVARNLVELEKLVESEIGPDVQSQIKIYRETLPNIVKVKKNMVQEADRLFHQSIKEYPRNLLEFELSLEVFYVFGILEKKMRDFLTKKRSELMKEMKSIEKKKFTSLQDLLRGLGQLFSSILSSLRDVCCAFSVTEKKTDSLSMEVGKNYFTKLLEKDKKLCPEHYFTRILLPPSKSSSSTSSIGKNGLLLRYLRVHCEHNHGFYVKHFPQIHDFITSNLLCPLYESSLFSSSDTTTSSSSSATTSMTSSLGSFRMNEFSQLLTNWVTRETRLKFRKLFEQILFAPFHEVFIQKMIYHRFRMELEQALFSSTGTSGSSLVPKTSESYDVISQFPSEKRLRKFLRNLLHELKKYQNQVGSRPVQTPSHLYNYSPFTPTEESRIKGKKKRTKKRTDDEEFEKEVLEAEKRTPLFEPTSGTVIYVEILEKIQVILTSLVDTYKGFVITKPNYVYFMKREEEVEDKSPVLKKRNLLLHKPNAYVRFHSKLFQHLEVLYVYLDDYLDLLVAPASDSMKLIQRYRTLFEDFENKMVVVRKLMGSLIQPLFDVFGKQISKIFFSIQFERYDEGQVGAGIGQDIGTGPSGGGSGGKVHWYVLELEKNLLSFNRNYLQLFGSGKYLRKMLKRRSERIVEEYCSAISLIGQPITKKGQMILLRELTQVDLSLCNSFYYVKNLSIYRDLSEFKGLLFLFEDREACWGRARKIAKVFVKKFVLLQYLLSHFVYVLRKSGSDDNSTNPLKSETFTKILFNFKGLKEYYAFLEGNEHDYPMIVTIIREKLKNYIKIAKMGMTSNLSKGLIKKEEAEGEEDEKEKEKEKEEETKEEIDVDEILSYLDEEERKEYEVILEIMEMIEKENQD